MKPQGVARVLAFHERRLIGQRPIDPDANSELLTVDSRQLGLGPVELSVQGLTESGSSVTCRPLRLNVIPGRPLPSQLMPVGEPTAQMMLTHTSASTPQAIESTADSAWLEQRGCKMASHSH